MSFNLKLVIISFVSRKLDSQNFFASDFMLIAASKKFGCLTSEHAAHNELYSATLGHRLWLILHASDGLLRLRLANFLDNIGRSLFNLSRLPQDRSCELLDFLILLKLSALLHFRSLKLNLITILKSGNRLNFIIQSHCVQIRSEPSFKILFYPINSLVINIKLAIINSLT